MPPKARKSIHDRGYQVLVTALRAARRRAKVTQIELSERLKADQSFVSRYERAERRLDVVEVRTICEALEIDFVELMGTFDVAMRRTDP